MRVASRQMPSLKIRPIGIFGWLVLGCFLAVNVYFALFSTKAFVLIVCGLAVLALLAHNQSKREKGKLLALASRREGQSICEFARDFDTRAVDTWVIRAVYEQLQNHLKYVHPSFPIRADDRLKEDLFLNDDDLDIDLAQEVEERTGRSVDGATSNPYSGRVRTVRDFVLFFQHQPRANSAT